MIGKKINEQGIRVRRLDRKNRRFCDPENYQILCMAGGVSGFQLEYTTCPVYPNTIAFLSLGCQVDIRFFCHPPPQGWIVSFHQDFFLKKPFKI
ncbi:MAG: hypothetical protein V2I46_12935 [Bacteroides sp.]|nr:hypothetical protein [Bacteroides sp.]